MHHLGRFHALAISVLFVAACGKSGGSDLFGSGAQDQDAGTGGQDGSDSCTSACNEGATRCAGDQVQTCEATSPGCSEWGAPIACPTDRPFCSAGTCAATCNDECPSEGARGCLNGQSVLCGNYDSDPCRDWGGATTCPSGEHCDTATGQCVLTCDAGTCPCSAGDTQPCADIGECHEGVRNCDNGSWGACQWQKGPSAEICDGKDNDCSGQIDDGLVAPACSKTLGVCAGTHKTCAGGWVDCSDADYVQWAMAHGHAYQSAESLCDGQDNDCNGKIDEPSNCCQPVCSGKGCGADNGCGDKCASGPCSGSQEQCQNGVCVCSPACSGKACGATDGCGGDCQTGACADSAATCQAGVCVCAHATCGSACCSAGQVCSLGACCSPSCGSHECGPDPVCGSSCGTCPGSQVCSAQGTCNGCTPSGVIHPYASTSVNGDALMAYDGTGHAHLSAELLSTGQVYVNNVSGSWANSTFGSSHDVGAASMAIDSQGHAHLCFKSWVYSTTYALSYATNAGGAWVTASLVSPWTAWDCRIAVDSADKVHLMYRASDGLKYTNNASGSWSTAQVIDASASATFEPDMKLDGAGKAHLAYPDTTNNRVIYATNAAGSWTTEIAAPMVGYAAILAVDSMGAPHILYSHNTGLSYTHKTASGWSAPVQVVSLGSNSAQYMRGVIDWSGAFHLVYRVLEGSNWGPSEYATNASGVWKNYAIGDTTGGDMGVAISPQGFAGLGYLTSAAGLNYETRCP